ncbi:hypothetical protein A2572_02845 [Candidatus Collierbacteria bacterium RIFOXYD1_FULL_40_9]|uniref:Uncharacterized protein n=1 Tax=Candidatus Collierbacteria bacterium RIFOXYD1_FULL_40_9 TaxID=1817731 RepID=A0A1F5FU20_9BACT|nr:MAG: hypothetical protein A2572_02845 [Candidatus Collierbacteria bacterium RIFOXYD1_FULL_40_9]
MKKLFLVIFSLLIAGCARSESIGKESTPTPVLDYNSAIQTLTINQLQDLCQDYLAPLGYPKFSAETIAADVTQNPGIIQAYIYPTFSVEGKPNTTVHFGPETDIPTAYRIIGTKVYLLVGVDRVNTTNIILKQNNGVIGYLAQFELSFDLKGDHQSIMPIGCLPIKNQ